MEINHLTETIDDDDDDENNIFLKKDGIFFNLHST